MININQLCVLVNMKWYRRKTHQAGGAYIRCCWLLHNNTYNYRKVSPKKEKPIKQMYIRSGDLQQWEPVKMDSRCVYRFDVEILFIRVERKVYHIWNYFCGRCMGAGRWREEMAGWLHARICVMRTHMIVWEEAGREALSFWLCLIHRSRYNTFWQSAIHLLSS